MNAKLCPSPNDLGTREAVFLRRRNSRTQTQPTQIVRGVNEIFQTSPPGNVLVSRMRIGISERFNGQIVVGLVCRATRQ
jgi:hypothetical protein